MSITLWKKLYHAKPELKCKECSKQFLEKSHFTIHMRVHTKEKPYTCIKCQKSFSQISGRNRHSLVCNDLRDVQCSLCPKKFRHDSEKDLHIKAFHLKQRDFKSNKCPKAFTDPTPLKDHTKTTHGDGSAIIKCTLCCNFQRHNYHNHREVLDGTGVYHCSLCNKTFSDKSLHNKKKHPKED